MSERVAVVSDGVIELSLCVDCVQMDANGWSVELAGRELPDPAPLSLVSDLVLGGDRSHECEGHFSWSPCDGCGCRLGGTRYCYIGVVPLAR